MSAVYAARISPSTSSASNAARRTPPVLGDFGERDEGDGNQAAFTLVLLDRRSSPPRRRRAALILSILVSARRLLLPPRPAGRSRTSAPECEGWDRLPRS